MYVRINLDSHRPQHRVARSLRLLIMCTFDTCEKFTVHAFIVVITVQFVSASHVRINAPAPLS